MKHILENGIEKMDRTGVGTKSIFGYQMRFDLSEGFPLLTTKKVHFKSIVHELLWFIHGDTNIRYLVNNGVGIWNDWPYQNWLRETNQQDEYKIYSPEWREHMKYFVKRIKEDKDFALQFGDLGPVYGKQWRDFGGIDQLKQLMTDLKNNANSRRLIVSAWNPSVLPNTSKSFSQNIDEGKAALPPCHAFFQFYVSNDKLSCQLYQRSADIFLGVPFNIASYSLLTYMIAQVCKYGVGDFIHTFGDAHIYDNHSNQIDEQLKRTPKSLPKIMINPNIDDIFKFKYEDFQLINYDPYPLIKGKVSV